MEAAGGGLKKKKTSMVAWERTGASRVYVGDSTEEDFFYDSEIERNLHKRRRELRRKQQEEAARAAFPEEAMAANANLSLRQLGKDPQKHLMEFHVVCSSMKPHGVTEEQIQLRAFPFSLKSSAKDWLYYLPSGSITTWTEMKRIFLEKYFPASRAANIRKEIYGCKQQMGESLHEYWERFKKLCASCPQHQISENLLIQYFYEGLLSHDRSMLDAASGGVFVDKTPVQARNLIENMAVNSQQFGTTRSDPAPRKRNGQIAKVCGICTQVGHATDMCPTLQEEYAEQVNAAGGFPGPPQQRYDPYSNTYNPDWKDHPNLRYGNPQANPPGPQAPQHNQSYRQPYPPPQRPQIPTPVVNPRENVSAITLRSGKELQIQNGLVKEPVETEGDEESTVEESEPIPKEAPRALKDSRKNEGIKELYETFRKCEVNISLLDAIKQVSAVIQRKVPAKCKDPGMFSIPCKIGDVQLDTAMLDLGASINVMPYSVYASLNLGSLNETVIVIQMADRSTIFPRGLLEDVLVQVGELVFPADFYIFDMKNNELNNPILLGRPFLKTSKSVIDVDNGTLAMELDGKIAKFNIFYALKNPVCESVVNILATPAEISTAENFISDMQAPKTATKHPPDRAKRIAKKSKQKKHGTLTGKIMKIIQGLGIFIFSLLSTPPRPYFARKAGIVRAHKVFDELPILLILANF
ncbi:uncharacterized protein [Henckelia pumila]|uniref:uncharacterized protein n=1 Tax=Henckelia pumila TaxID=405737 RepID=UPI003C6DFBBF